VLALVGGVLRLLGPDGGELDELEGAHDAEDAQLAQAAQAAEAQDGGEGRDNGEQVDQSPDGEDVGQLLLGDVEVGQVLEAEAEQEHPLQRLEQPRPLLVEGVHGLHDDGGDREEDEADDDSLDDVVLARGGVGDGAMDERAPAGAGGRRWGCGGRVGDHVVRGDYGRRAGPMARASPR